MRACPWNNKAHWGHQLFDAPLATALLRSIIGNAYHFCHSTMHIKLHGCKSVGPHRDHLHWFNDNPVNLADRDKWYVQMLYYPTGFKKGGTNLSVVPGSNLCTPTERHANIEELLKEKSDEEAGRE